mmetsp:Transcript_30671/g.66291  ORF Transcript_30671/g.66291 Transcript_30671/m.66291 type:complete len:371 (+) Transcript_30671:1467-2579(+)
MRIVPSTPLHRHYYIPPIYHPRDSSCVPSSSHPRCFYPFRCCCCCCYCWHWEEEMHSDCKPRLYRALPFHLHSIRRNRHWFSSLALRSTMMMMTTKKKRRRRRGRRKHFRGMTLPIETHAYEIIRSIPSMDIRSCTSQQSQRRQPYHHHCWLIRIEMDKENHPHHRSYLPLLHSAVDDPPSPSRDEQSSRRNQQRPQWAPPRFFSWRPIVPAIFVWHRQCRRRIGLHDIGWLWRCRKLISCYCRWHWLCCCCCCCCCCRRRRHRLRCYAACFRRPNSTRTHRSEERRSRPLAVECVLGLSVVVVVVEVATMIVEDGFVGYYCSWRNRKWHCIRLDLTMAMPRHRRRRDRNRDRGHLRDYRDCRRCLPWLR